MKKLCILLVRFYQRFLSPLKRSPCCRFTPTCSAYAIQAFEKRGFFVGMILTVYRLLRCNPFCAPGYDPVPEYGFATMGRGLFADNVSDDAIDPSDTSDTPDDRSDSVPKPICEDYLSRRPTHNAYDSDRDGQSQSQGE